MAFSYYKGDVEKETRFFDGEEAIRVFNSAANFFLDKATAAGYKEYQPPILVNEDSMGELFDHPFFRKATKGWL